MTEIPEHLLKRSRERRGALGLPGGEDAAAAGAPAASAPSAGSSPAPAAASAPPAPPRPPKSAPAANAPAPKPPHPSVAAATARKKIPFWAMPVLALLPIWGFLYMEAMAPQKKVVKGPLAEGASVYANCASCHGGAGEGGTGYAFANGEVNKSFDNLASMITWVQNGTANTGAGKAYGNGRHVAGGKGLMPGWKGQLTDQQIIAVVCHEFFTLGGADPTGAKYQQDYADYCVEGAPKFTAAAG